MSDKPDDDSIDFGEPIPPLQRLHTVELLHKGLPVPSLQPILTPKPQSSTQGSEGNSQSNGSTDNQSGKK